MNSVFPSRLVFVVLTGLGIVLAVFLFLSQYFLAPKALAVQTIKPGYTCQAASLPRVDKLIDTKLAATAKSLLKLEEKQFACKSFPGLAD